jgi:hypothetical protein
MEKYMSRVEYLSNYDNLEEIDSEFMSLVNLKEIESKELKVFKYNYFDVLKRFRTLVNYKDIIVYKPIKKDEKLYTVFNDLYVVEITYKGEQYIDLAEIIIADNCDTKFKSVVDISIFCEENWKEEIEQEDIKIIGKAVAIIKDTREYFKDYGCLYDNRVDRDMQRLKNANIC